MILSHSSSTKYLECTQAFHYAYVQKLRPIATEGMPSYLFRGIKGHKALEILYKTGKRGEMNEYLDKEMEAHSYDYELLKIVAALKFTLTHYVDYYPFHHLKMLAVEEKMFTDLDPVTGTRFGIVPDLVVEHVAGPLKGLIEVLDHKFLANFKSELEIRIDTQLLKYIKVLRDNGFPVGRATFNQVRTTSFKTFDTAKTFRRTPVPLTPKKIDRVWQGLVDVGSDIAEAREPRRINSPLICKSCAFVDLCMTELEGNDSTLIRESFFEHRDSPFDEETETSDSE